MHPYEYDVSKEIKALKTNLIAFRCDVYIKENLFCVCLTIYLETNSI